MNNLKIYVNKSDHNIINKNIELISELNCTFKNDIDILKPRLIIKNYVSGNYCFISDFNRFYYITDIILLKGDVYQLNCTVDVLKTYANELENSDYYSDDGILIAIENEINFSDVYNPEKFIMMLGE